MSHHIGIRPVETKKEPETVPAPEPKPERPKTVRKVTKRSVKKEK